MQNKKVDLYTFSYELDSGLPLNFNIQYEYFQICQITRPDTIGLSEDNPSVVEGASHK